MQWGAFGLPTLPQQILRNCPMPLSDTFTRLPLSAITVLRDDRQRRDLELDPQFLASVKKWGVMQPIIVQLETKEGTKVFPPYDQVLTALGLPNAEQLEEGRSSFRVVLVAGERRLEASRQLSLPDIPVRFAHELSPVESQILELEENLKRRDLAWQDQVRAIARIHELHKSIDYEWTQAETADACHMTQPHISLCLSIARHPDDDKRIWEAGTAREAYNVIDRRQSREMGDALEELLGEDEPQTVFIDEDIKYDPNNVALIADFVGEGREPKTYDKFETRSLVSSSNVSEVILHEDFLTWAPTYSGPKFNFLHIDFPYGIDPFSGEQGRGANPDSYTDEATVYWQLLNCLLDNLPRLMSVSAHMMFWYSDKHRQDTLNLFQAKAPSLVCHVFPLIWHKTDNAGIAGDARRHPRHIYETCLLFSHCARQLVGIKGDVYGCQTDHRLHPSTKPESMLRHFFSMFVDENSTVFDPTTGSGSSLRAAESLGARYVLGLEKDWNYAETARKALREARLLRQGERAIR